MKRLNSSLRVPALAAVSLALLTGCTHTTPSTPTTPTPITSAPPSTEAPVHDETAQRVQDYTELTVSLNKQTAGPAQAWSNSGCAGLTAPLPRNCTERMSTMAAAAANIDKDLSDASKQSAKGYIGAEPEQLKEQLDTIRLRIAEFQDVYKPWENGDCSANPRSKICVEGTDAVFEKFTAISSAAYKVSHPAQ